MTDTTLEEEEKPTPLSPAAKISGGLWTIVSLLTVFTFWQQPFFLNLASAFRFQLLLILGVVSLPPFFLFPGRRKLLFAGLPLVVGLTFLGYLPTRSSHQKPDLKVVVSNVNSSNRDLSGLKAWLSRNPADLVGILEVSPVQVPQLQEMGYPHVLLEPRNSNFGIGLLSREEPRETVLIGKDTPFPSIYAEFDRYRVLLTHPVPPLDREYRRAGDDQIEQLLEPLKQEAGKPTLFMGDLNATGWDLRTFPLKEQGFRESREGFGLLPTWPVASPPVRIPIDHIFVNRSVEVVDCSRGPDVGSDHFPLRAELKML